MVKLADYPNLSKAFNLLKFANSDPEGTFLHMFGGPVSIPNNGAVPEVELYNTESKLADAEAELDELTTDELTTLCAGGTMFQDPPEVSGVVEDVLEELREHVDSIDE
jgi:hypothetical protein